MIEFSPKRMAWRFVCSQCHKPLYVRYTQNYEVAKQEVYKNGWSIDEDFELIACDECRSSIGKPNWYQLTKDGLPL